MRAVSVFAFQVIDFLVYLFGVFYEGLFTLSQSLDDECEVDKG